MSFKKPFEVPQRSVKIEKFTQFSFHLVFRTTKARGGLIQALPHRTPVVFDVFLVNNHLLHYFTPSLHDLYMPHHVCNTNSLKKSVSFQFFYQIFGFRWTNLKGRTSSLGQCSSQVRVITLVFHARVTNHITIKISVLSKHLNLNPFYACVAFHIKNSHLANQITG